MANNPAVEAALELQGSMREGGFRFRIIGGLAVNRWGEPRFTHDAEATVLTQIFDDERVVDYLLERFRARYPDHREAALRNRVVLLPASNEVSIDVALGAMDFEVRSMDGATPWKFRDNWSLVTCSAEDRIVHKAFADRGQDWVDVEGILQRPR